MLQFRRWLAKVIMREVTKNLRIKVLVHGGYIDADLQSVNVEVQLYYKDEYISQSEGETWRYG